MFEYDFRFGKIKITAVSNLFILKIIFYFLHINKRKENERNKNEIAFKICSKNLNCINQTNIELCKSKIIENSFKIIKIKEIDENNE